MSPFRRRWIHHLGRAYQILQHEGLKAFLRKAAPILREFAFPRSYERWIARYDTLNQTTRQQIKAEIAELRSRPTVSIIMPVCGEAGKWFRSTINSIEAQLYPYWELCLSVGPSARDKLREELDTLEKRDNRIHVAQVDNFATWADKANGALALATGDFVAPLDVGDALAEDALYWVAKEARDDVGADLIFSDEDTIEGNAHRVDPWFKPDWNPALMLACNAFGRLGAYRRSLVQRLGGFRAGFDGAEEYDLVLRCAAATEVNRIRHIARVLYHRRAIIRVKERQGQSSNEDASWHAIADHLAAQGIVAKVSGGNGEYRLTYAMPIPHPRVSVIIATTARPDIAEPCSRSLLQRTTYDDLEVLLLVNRSVLNVSERADFLRRIAQKPRVRVIEYPDSPFNYSAVNNFGAAQAAGQVLCFLNDDTEIVTADWLEVLVSRVSLPQVAAAGPMLITPTARSSTRVSCSAWAASRATLVCTSRGAAAVILAGRVSNRTSRALPPLAWRSVRTSFARWAASTKRCRLPTTTSICVFGCDPPAGASSGRPRRNSCITNRLRSDATTRARALSSTRMTLLSCASAGDRSCRWIHSTTSTLD